MSYTEKQNEVVDFSKLPITNNFMFCNVMMDESICKEFLETIMKIKIDRIVYINSEQQKSATIDSKTVRFDVYVEDESRVFDIEMQMTDTLEIPLRARYYQSAIDVTHLRKNQDYSTLCESFIIFIMPKDIFGGGFPQYTFENTCRENPDLKLGDKTQKIFYNFSEYAKEKDDKVRNILKYFKDGEPSDGLTERMNAMLDHLKNDAEVRDRYMLVEMELIMQEKKANLKTARNLLAKGIAIDVIAECTSLTIAEVTALQAEATTTV